MPLNPLTSASSLRNIPAIFRFAWELWLGSVTAESLVPLPTSCGADPRGTHLWEFIRDILLNPDRNPGLIKWEDRAEGVFRFLKSEAVAQLWGKKKNNSSMTYEKLSRAMRYCQLTAGPAPLIHTHQKGAWRLKNCPRHWMFPSIGRENPAQSIKFLII